MRRHRRGLLRPPSYCCDEIRRDALGRGGTRVLRHGRRGQPELRVAVDEHQHRGQRQGDPQQDQPVHADRRARQDLDDAVREDPRRHPVVERPDLARDAVQQRQDTEAGDQPGKARRVAQVAHHEQVRRRADERGDRDRHDERRPDRPARRVLQVVEREGARHADRAVGEVEDARSRGRRGRCRVPTGRRWLLRRGRGRRTSARPSRSPPLSPSIGEGAIRPSHR